MARTITITTTPQEIIPADPTRDVLEILNDGTVKVFVRHGGVLNLAEAANCGVPVAPQASRAVSGPAARLAVMAAVESGQPSTVLHYHEYSAIP